MDFITSIKNKDILVNTTIDILNNEGKLPGITKNYSYEGGFNLPMTKEWVINNKYHNKDLAIKYHNERQLRFKDDGNIITGLRFKDDCEYWSKEELSILNEVINRVLNELN